MYPGTEPLGDAIGRAVSDAIDDSAGYTFTDFQSGADYLACLDPYCDPIADHDGTLTYVEPFPACP